MLEFFKAIAVSIGDIYIYIYSEVELVDHMTALGSSVFIFICFRNVHTVFQLTIPISIPISSISTSFLDILANT